MPKKRFSAEQIIVVLRQIEVLMSQGKTRAVACREAGVSQQSCATNASTRRSSTASRKPRSSSSNGAINTTPLAHIPRSDIGHLHRRHPQANRSSWIAMLQSSNLYLLGPKYPSGHSSPDHAALVPRFAYHGTASAGAEPVRSWVFLARERREH
jgi:hypothetical protein